ncbi:MAG: chromate efflux transporter [Flavobacteriales bacterium]|nr:chromate efflux transporter [Flavobacteriales bacterium]
MDKTLGHRILQVAGLFLKLGVIAFGGPAAHIALMQKEVVEKRKWISEQHYLDLIGITSLIPGPNSTEMVMHCGKERAGIGGLFVAGAAFIIPAVLITLGMAILYQQYAHLPNVAPWIYGVKAGIIALIISAVIKLAKKAVKGWVLGLIGGLAVLAGLLGQNEILIILCAGLLNLGLKQLSFLPSFILPLQIIGEQITQKSESVTHMKVFLVFLKMGSVLFGSGYLLFAYLDAELVESLKWITRDQLAEAVAVGNITPGPVLSTATYVGYQLDGYWGAGLATLGIFLPSFIIIMIISPFIPKLRNSKVARTLINGVNVGALAMMIVVTYKLGMELLVDWRSITVFGIALATMIFYSKINSVLFIAGCSLSGFLLHLIAL